MPYPQTNLDDVKERADDQCGAKDCTPHVCSRAAWLTHLPAWACVALGGFCGSALRLGADLAAAGGPRIGVFSWSTVCVNLVGAFFLGYLTAWAQGYLDDGRMRRNLLLFAGTGFSGALTTYATMVMASLHSGIQAMTAVPAAEDDVSVGFATPLAALVQASFPILIEGMLASLVLIALGIVLAALGWMAGSHGDSCLNSSDEVTIHGRKS